MAWFIGQSILMIALAFLLGLLVGWLIWGRLLVVRRASEAAPAATTAPTAPTARAAKAATPSATEAAAVPDEAVAAEAEPKEAAPVAAAPVATAGPEGAEVEPEPEPTPVAVAVIEPDDVEPDDLERIEGIGPAMSRALVAAGIKTYEQLANAADDTLRDAIQSQGLKFAPSLVTWARQARLLADGDEEGFADLTRRLVAGRDEGRA